MKYPSLGSVGTCLFISTSAIVGCSGSSSPATTPGTGGGVGVGGSATALSSSPGAGGASHATGGASAAASTSAPASATGGKVGTGGTTSSPASATGGASTSSPGTGGAKASGGSSAATGGAKATGGAAGVGGTKANGGSSAATGGTKANGGSSAVTGGAAAGGSTGAPGSDPVKSEGCGKTSTLKNGTGLKITLTSPGSGDRNYNLKLPDNYDNTHPYRLIMSYHWVGGTANDVSNGGVAKPYYGLWDLAQGSAIFAAPDGTPNTIMGSGGNMWANSNGSDVEFSRQLITYLESELCIDKSRVFCEGFSMGGSMSYAMACGLGDMVRAVAVHSGGSMSGCAAHSKPVAYFMTHGINDSVCSYPSYGVPQLQDFAKTNGCTSPNPTVSQSAFAALMPTPTDSSGKTPVCIDFEGCKAGYPTRACIFVGDHTPSPDGTSGWVPKESWKFLSQF